MYGDTIEGNSIIANILAPVTDPEKEKDRRGKLSGKVRRLPELRARAISEEMERKRRTVEGLEAVQL